MAGRVFDIDELDKLSKMLASCELQDFEDEKQPVIIGGMVQDVRTDKYLMEKERERNIPGAIEAARRKLPVYNKREYIVDKIRKHRVVMITGETGSGKTTQVAQYVLEDCIAKKQGSITNIVVTQPRRISAISVANRVAEERRERIMDAKRDRQDASIGYEIRFESVMPRKRGSIMFCTTGILLQKLRDNPNLNKISHVILDEVHERDLLCDVLVGVLTDLLQRREDLKVILMSASLDVKKFRKHMKQEQGSCPLIDIEGRLHKVQEFYLEDIVDLLQGPRRQQAGRSGSSGRRGPPAAKISEYMNRYPRTFETILMHEKEDEVNLQLVAMLIHRINRQQDTDGAILVFLPGWDQIDQLA